MEPIDPEVTVTSCETCDTLTTNAGTRRCDACWEVESRIIGYLLRGGEKARQLVVAALVRTRVPGR